MFLVLHGQTEWNAQRRVQGHLNSPLTELGRQQAASAGRILRHRQFDGIVSSPLGRTMETARIIAAETGFDFGRIRQDDRLKEVFLGQWEGLTHAEVAERWPERLAGTDRYDWFFRSPDGESYAGVARRLAQWLRTCRAHENLIVVTHGIASRVLRGLYQNLPIETALQLEIARDAVLHLHEGTATRMAGEGGGQRVRRPTPAS